MVRCRVSTRSVTPRVASTARRVAPRRSSTWLRVFLLRRSMPGEQYFRIEWVYDQKMHSRRQLLSAALTVLLALAGRDAAANLCTPGDNASCGSAMTYCCDNGL